MEGDEKEERESEDRGDFDDGKSLATGWMLYRNWATGRIVTERWYQT